jgi:hypothetical protein
MHTEFDSNNEQKYYCKSYVLTSQCLRICGSFGLVWTGSEQGPVADSCKNGNKRADSIRLVEFLEQLTEYCISWLPKPLLRSRQNFWFKSCWLGSQWYGKQMPLTLRTKPEKNVFFINTFMKIAVFWNVRPCILSEILWLQNFLNVKPCILFEILWLLHSINSEPNKNRICQMAGTNWRIWLESVNSWQVDYGFTTSMTKTFVSLWEKPTGYLTRISEL